MSPVSVNDYNHPFFPSSNHYRDKNEKSNVFINIDLYSNFHLHEKKTVYIKVDKTNVFSKRQTVFRNTVTPRHAPYWQKSLLATQCMYLYTISVVIGYQKVGFCDQPFISCLLNYNLRSYSNQSLSYPPTSLVRNGVTS